MSPQQRALENMILQRMKGHNFILSSACQSRGCKPNSKCHKTHWEAVRIATPHQEPQFGIGHAEEGGRGGQKRDWQRFASLRGTMALSLGMGRRWAPLWEDRWWGGFHWCHMERNFLLLIHKRPRKKWRELCLLLPDIITSSKIWKETHTVAWHMIKALHIHHCGKKMYPKNSLLVTENACVST